MAINFPNYLAAQLYTPDFSGIGNVVENYYKGKAMPKDDLIKQIQAQFARPTAEASLTSTRLGNEQTRLAIAKERLEQQQNAALNAEISKALGGIGAVPNAPAQGNMGVPQGVPSPVQGGQPMPQQQPNPNDMTFQQGKNPLENLHPAIAQAIQQIQQRQQQPNQANPAAAGQQMPQEGQQPSTAGALPQGVSMPAGGQGAIPVESDVAEQNPMQVLVPGEPRLAAIDALYDRNPLSRALLEKKGFKKTQKIDFDKKTGQTRVTTTYPSGKVTIQTVSSPGTAGDGIPLTNKMVSKHQNIVSSVDVALPILDKILDLKGFSAYPLSSMGIPSVFGNKQAMYDSLVNQALDSLMGAFGLPLSNEGLKTVKDQLQIRHLETPSAYRKRIGKLVEELKSRKAYSAEQVRKSNKIQPVGRSEGGSDLSSMSDDELQGIANG